MVSLEDRLPARASAEASPLSHEIAARLDRLESSFELDSPGRRRNYALRQLHEHAVRVFIDQPGFGVTRMSGISERSLRDELRDTEIISQPGMRLPPASLAATLEGQKPLKQGSEDIIALHEKGLIDFVYPSGFGYFRDRQHVAGFQAHQFSKVPPSPDPWRLQTLDLVGLVVHDAPLAYVSDSLPRMDELRDSPTRPLDEFETTGLAALRRGEDLFASASAEGMRALGAVRSTKQCLTCHEGARRDLLGAFSYTFARSFTSAEKFRTPTPRAGFARNPSRQNGRVSQDDVCDQLPSCENTP
jgi:hypothetical protein